MIPIPPIIAESQMWTPEQQRGYEKRANKAMEEKDPRVVGCVEILRKLTNGSGYGAPDGLIYGDYSSYEYCQWMKE